MPVCITRRNKTCTFSVSQAAPEREATQIYCWMKYLKAHKNNGTIQEINADGMAIPGLVNLDAEKLEKIFGAQGQAVYENAQSLLKQAYQVGKNLVS
ncbi:hypothetical protein [Desulfosporosinus meridiei]|uniref:hypothetical protein n=1 Tax=Desulfosporosinus meridiei TaxID=79209 RepID=UPI00023151AA|nr:hypothetical protein [Desulfosporosinus meridiei]